MVEPHYYVAFGLFGAVSLYSVFATRKALKDGAAQPERTAAGIRRLRTHFAATSKPEEGEPVCVVAFHIGSRTMDTVFVGVTNERIVACKDDGSFHEFPYDYEGEHLQSAEKERQGRGFFSWSHSEELPGGRSGYVPDVKNFPPFANEEWTMYPEVPGHPEQLESLRQFSSIFYFKWFY